jgi:hypothetical protein
VRAPSNTRKSKRKSKPTARDVDIAVGCRCPASAIACGELSTCPSRVRAGSRFSPQRQKPVRARRDLFWHPARHVSFPSQLGRRLPVQAGRRSPSLDVSVKLATPRTNKDRPASHVGTKIAKPPPHPGLARTVAGGPNHFATNANHDGLAGPYARRQRQQALVQTMKFSRKEAWQTEVLDHRVRDRDRRQDRDLSVAPW